MPSNSTRQTGRTAPCQATLRGEEAKQLLTEQPYDAEKWGHVIRTSTFMNPTVPWLPVMRLTGARMYQSSMKTRQTLLAHASHDKSHRHQTTSRPMTRHAEWVTGSLYQRHKVSPCMSVNAPWLHLVGPIKPPCRWPRHKSLYSNPYTRSKDGAIHHVRYTLRAPIGGE
jgi:hypothetical protein